MLGLKFFLGVLTPNFVFDNEIVEQMSFRKKKFEVSRLRFGEAIVKWPYLFGPELYKQTGNAKL